ncbi:MULTISPECIES: 4Fe-4S dicluster domain-containing protein [unclassified Adlercreutzia]|uniref:4Fe-4S dicluster domain-containing protein n=1 Tax=unclassified Adlercreutzia TaxID=2636013 RepID=UPI0013EDD693|nr:MULTISPECIES: 4Fe-4S dicluster domain-containing protein [unclassified Adlercreutzia]
MGKPGLLIDYEWCTGCHSCEMACKAEHGFGEGQCGIKLHKNGPWQIKEDKWEYAFIPIPTSLCDMCADRVAEGRVPTCVHHCQALVMEFGDVEELAKKMDKKQKVLFIPCD